MWFTRIVRHWLRALLSSIRLHRRSHPRLVLALLAAAYLILIVRELLLRDEGHAARVKAIVFNRAPGSDLFPNNRQNSNERAISDTKTANSNNEERQKVTIKYSMTNSKSSVAALSISKQNDSSNARELCAGFKEEQEARLRDLRAKCEALRNKYEKLKRSDAFLTQHGTTRVYLHHNRSLMWCETPKAMSTSWGRAVFALEGRDTSTITYVRVHIWMHDTFEYLAPTILTMNTFSHVGKFSAYKKLFFIRDPFTRFLSAYLDKVKFPAMTYHDLVNRIKQQTLCNFSKLQSQCYKRMANLKLPNISALIRRLKCHHILYENNAPVILSSAGLRDQLVELIGRDIDFQKEAISLQMCNQIKVPLPSNYNQLFKQCTGAVLLKSCPVNLTSAPVPTFKQFTRFVLDAHDPKYALDRHWSPMSLNCAPCSVPYTHILRHESMVRDVECSLRDVYPPDAYANLPAPSLYTITNSTLKVVSPKENPLAKLKAQSITSLNVPEGTVGALRPRERDYKREGSKSYLKDHYEQLSPDLMRRLWDFYRDDTQLLGYDPEPDFGINKFQKLHA